MIYTAAAHHRIAELRSILAGKLEWLEIMSAMDDDASAAAYHLEVADYSRHEDELLDLTDLVANAA